NIIGRDITFGYGKSGIAEPSRSQRTSGRGHDRETIRREASQEVGSTGNDDHALFVLNFHLIDSEVFFLGLQFGSDGADGFDAAAAMCHFDDVVGIAVVLRCPFAPYTLNCGGGVNQDTIKIEENCLRGKNHLSEYQQKKPESGSP